jgi:hypothetical protein
VTIRTLEPGEAVRRHVTRQLAVRRMACHEMGHALGMGHNSDVGSCINPNIQNFSYADLPDSDGFTLIAQLYNDGNE